MFAARNLGGEPNRFAACLLLTLYGNTPRPQVNDPRGDAGAAVFTGDRDGARDDAGLLRRIGRGDEDAMAEFFASAAGSSSLRFCW